MKVKELIKELEQMNQELEVCTQEEDSGEWIWYSVDIVEVRKDVTYHHMDGHSTEDVIYLS